MENIYSYKTAALTASFKDLDSKKGIVTGYFASFGNKDSDGDIIVKGAFERTIKERGPESAQPRIKHLLNHRTDQPLGKILILKEDSRGLYYESQIGKHTAGIEFLKMVDSDLITEHSIGFRTIKWEKDQSDEGVMRLTELQLWEGSSLTSWGANSLTPLTGTKSEYKEEIDKFTKSYKYFENNLFDPAFSDDRKEDFLLYNKQLLQIIIDLTKKATGPDEPSTSPEKHDKELSDMLNNYVSSFNLSCYELGRLQKGFRPFG